VATWGKARKHSEEGFFSFLLEFQKSWILKAGERNCTMGIPDCGVVGSDEAGKFLTDTIISELVAAKLPDLPPTVATE
jgi:hypothetical protein